MARGQTPSEIFDRAVAEGYRRLGDVRVRRTDGARVSFAMPITARR